MGGLLTASEIARLGALYGGLAGGLLAKGFWDAIAMRVGDPAQRAVFASLTGAGMMVVGAMLYFASRKSPNPVLSMLAYMMGTAGAVLGFSPYFVKDKKTNQVLLYTLMGMGYANVQGKWFALGFNALGLAVAVLPLIAVLYIALR